MKRWYFIMAGLIIIVQSLHGDAVKYTLRGGLAGAATGLLVSEFSDRIDTRDAIPFFTGAGALAGYSVYRYRQDRRYGPRHVSWLAPAIALPYAAYTWPGHYRYRSPSNHARWGYDHSVKPSKTASDREMAAPSTERHPGVELVTVDLTLANGHTHTMTLLKLGNRYVGPQGETYSERPTAEILRQHYYP